ncbi:MAG TPA: PEP-CTERM sorting domain-containing protein [Phycisphaerae bacterium]|nr:PEP-CTERM sorting domain-containing protein [Phycisphaerae bacterium]HOI56342.1 PEP-CTERM sorting domain-containing protein [Phycisphaerae bacterium]
MRKLLGVVLLTFLAVPASADVLLSLTRPQYGTASGIDYVYVDLRIVDLGAYGLPDCEELVTAFGAKLVARGADAARLEGFSLPVQDKTAAEMAAIVSPSTYAWMRTPESSTGAHGFGSKVVSDKGSGFVSFGHNALETDAEVEVLPGVFIPNPLYDAVLFRDIQAGDVVARFCFFDRLSGTPFTDLTFDLIGYDTPGEGAAFTLIDGRTVKGDLVPEPATLGLLGLGAVGLIWRRRRWK